MGKRYLLHTGDSARANRLAAKVNREYEEWVSREMKDFYRRQEDLEEKEQAASTTETFPSPLESVDPK